MKIGDQELRELLDGTLDLERVREIQRQKDDDRSERVLALEQQRVPWDEPIVLCLQAKLYVVEGPSEKTVRCQCGHDFGSYKVNWKESALVYDRDPQDGEIYAHANAPDRDWLILREFYCPGCGAQLDVEVVPEGYPFIFNFLPYFPDEDNSGLDA